MSKPRRVRYTVEAQQGQFGELKKFDYLVYPHDLTGARAQLIRKGWRIKSFKPAAEDRFSNPNAGWRLSSAGLQWAKNEFGLTLPLKIKQTSSVGGQEGCWYPKIDGSRFFHSITAKSYLTPERASEVLWHELTHAMQGERAIAGHATLYAQAEAMKAWFARDNQRPYKERLSEREANRNMQEYAKRVPLAIRA